MIKEWAGSLVDCLLVSSKIISQPLSTKQKECVFLLLWLNVIRGLVTTQWWCRTGKECKVKLLSVSQQFWFCLCVEKHDWKFKFSLKKGTFWCDHSSLFLLFFARYLFPKTVKSAWVWELHCGVLGLITEGHSLRKNYFVAKKVWPSWL